MDQAGCREFPELPWTGDGPDVHRMYRQAMRAVCWSCPVLAACEAYADAKQITGGFWAGRFYPRFEPPGVWRPGIEPTTHPDHDPDHDDPENDPDHDQPSSHELVTESENGDCA